MGATKIKAGIVGAAGYTGGELIRLLINHPEVQLVFAHSKSQAGLPVSSVHKDLFGDTNLVFSDTLDVTVDVVFLCLGHGEAAKFLAQNIFPESIKIIDLSQDFRLTSSADPQLETHNPKPETNLWVYGLPELNLEAIKKAKKIANPGCFATAIQLGLLPLAKSMALNKPIHITAITGSTGAGQGLSATSHFSWRSNNLSVYKAFEHQHEAEIKQSLGQLQGYFDVPFQFVPMRGDFARGIIASITLETQLSLEQAVEVYTAFYANHPFTHVSPSNIDLKQVVNTNKCLIYLEKHGDVLHVVCVIDNLLKGASGQAVQNMNLLFGLDQTTGLRLKGVGY